MMLAVPSLHIQRKICYINIGCRKANSAPVFFVKKVEEGSNMNKLLTIFLTVCLLSSNFIVCADDSVAIDEDPANYRNVEEFYKDENGYFNDNDAIAVQSINSLRQDELIHQDRFITTIKHVGIDASEWQKNIDWSSLRNQGVEFAIIRVGYRGYVSGKLVKDKFAEINLENAKKAGVKVGVYFYSKAVNENEAKKEADFVNDIVTDYSLDLPIFMDVEYDGDGDRLYQKNLSIEKQTSIVNAFIHECNNFGYSAGVYASANVLKNKMNAESIEESGYVWLAHWTKDTDYSGKYNFWQYNGSSGNVILDGVYGAVDTDIWYDDGTVFNNVINSIDMYRIYNPNSGEHFYTADENEKNHLVGLGWRYEGIGWIAPKTSSIPVYRLYNKNGGEHHYTMDASERDMLVSKGWKYEGIGWYSADPNDSSSIPVLREYNPNAFANNHNYTKDVEEHNMLMRVGWRDEGKAWYSIQ